MSLIHIENVELAYGHHALLDHVSAVIQPGDRIGLLGRNGTGKSSLLKLLADEQKPDSGNIWRTASLRIAKLEQTLPDSIDQSIYDYVAAGLNAAGECLQRYHALISHPLDENGLTELAEVQQKLEAVDGWNLQIRVDSILQRLTLPADSTVASLSGGWRRRAALARALVQAPDVLLLDEPTNHLDIDTIRWLEQEIAAFRGAIILVTHDRAFLQAIANQIWELDRGQLYIWRGDYQGFLEYRDQRLASEEKTQHEFDKKLAEEEKWIRTGVKARRTRNEGRVRALEELREQRAQRRQQTGKAVMTLEQAIQSGKLVAELDHVSYSIGEKTIINDLSLSIIRGDRIGFIGGNGSGKSTLLKLILGDLVPTTGNIKRGTKLEVAYFDQLRNTLDLTANAIDNVAGGRDFIDIEGKAIHAVSYLNRFLFESARLRTPVGQLSGGEQNRLILAKLFSQPANLLVLDEPTNDLDLETLELLEELLTEFDGTVLLVSHDRHFVDNVVTSSLIFDGSGDLQEHVGGYTDWQRFIQTQSSLSPTNQTSVKSPASTEKKKTTTKLSYQLQRELSSLPEKIAALEHEIKSLEVETLSHDFYKRSREETAPILQSVLDKQKTLQSYYDRWEELETLEA
jgi:ATP-binding cassette subfamily F protein uup